MPVPILQTDAKLDRIIQVSEISVGTPGGLPYGVRQIHDQVNLGSLVIQWAAAPVGDDIAQWVLFFQPAFRNVGATVISGGFDTLVYWPLEGLFPLQTPLQIRGVNATIASLAIYPGGGLDVVDDPVIQENGDASFERGRSGFKL